MRLLWLAAALCIPVTASAQDAQLKTLKTTLASLRTKDPAQTPDLTIAKRQLRDWIESQLASLKNGGEEELPEFVNRLNQLLRAIDDSKPAEDQNLLGTVGDVRVSDESGVLIVISSLGILCQHDQSAYGYKLVEGHWQRVWESEQTDYSPKKYNPQHISAVHVSLAYRDGHASGPPFVMTLGNEWGCASTWHMVYYRVWRVDSAGPKLLIDRAEGAWLRTGTFAVGSITQGWERNAPVDVLVEFTEGSIDGGVHNREAVRHFLIEGDTVRRVDPVALSPRDFVDEWLTQDWNESLKWSALPALQQWHSKLHADFVSGSFDNTMHCKTPDLWQVTVEPHDAKKDFAPGPKAYFLVRWRPPYHFTMMNISAKPWPACNEDDREADEWRTLFSTQDWRR